MTALSVDTAVTVLSVDIGHTSPSIRVNGTLSSDKRCIASAFNTFFVSAATRLVDSLRSSCVPSQRQSGLFTREYPPFKFQEVSEEVVLVQLRGLKVGKAVGLDNIPARLLKDSAGIVNKPLTRSLMLRYGRAKFPVIGKLLALSHYLRKEKWWRWMTIAPFLYFL